MTSKSYKAIEAEIEKLKKQATAVRKAELKAVIAGIRKQIVAHGLTAEELGLSGAAPTRKANAAAPRKAARPATTGVAKYRDPVTQKTWTGRGKPPLWIVGTKNREAFLIDAPAPVATVEAAPTSPARRATKAAKAAKAETVTPTPKAPKSARKAAPARKRASKSAAPDTPA